MHKETKLCQIRPCDYDTELNDLLNVSKIRIFFFENYVNSAMISDENNLKFSD